MEDEIKLAPLLEAAAFFARIHGTMMDRLEATAYIIDDDNGKRKAIALIGMAELLDEATKLLSENLRIPQDEVFAQVLRLAAPKNDSEFRRGLDKIIGQMRENR